jgi:formate hydrogenlyase transcriptional activator
VKAPDFRLLIDSTPGLIHTGLPDGYLDFFNQTWLTYIGRPLEDVQGWKWTECIHPDDVEEIVEKWRASLATGEPFLHEARVRRADGEYRWMLHHKVALRDERGDIVKWYGSSVDIEDRKRTEEELRVAMSERARLAGLRAEIGMALARKDNLKGILDLCARALVRHLNAAFARVWTLNGDGQELVLQASAGMYTRLDGQYGRMPFGKLKIGSIAQTRQPHVTNDVQNDPRVDNHEWARAEKMTSFAGYPLVVEDRVVGVMGMFSRNALNQGTIDTLSFIADGIAQTIERKHAEGTLQRREAYLAEAQGLSHTGSFGWKPESGEIVWSDETYRIFEYERDVKPTIDLVAQRVHPEDRAEFHKVIDAASAGNAHFEHTYRLLLPDGRIKHIHALAHALEDAAGTREFVGAGIDVTFVKRAEEKLREREAELRLVLAELQRVVDLIPQHVVVLDAGGNAIFANQQVLEYTGLTVDEIQGVNFRARAFHPDDVERLGDDRQRALSGAVPFENEQRVLGKDGKYRWFLIRYNPLLDDSGNVLRWYCGATEITERKEAEQNLWHVIDTIPTLAWCNRPDGSNEFLNRNWHEYTGLSPEESHGWGWQVAFHPEDLPALMERWERMLVSGEPGEIEARLRRHDGVYRWFLIRAQPFRDEAGTIVRWYGTSTDIDDRKQAEDKLRQSERELRQLANMLPQCVVVLDKEGCLLQANKTMLDYYGQTLEEMRGSGTVNPLGKYLHPDDQKRVQSERTAALSRGAPFEVEKRLLGKDGRYRWFLFRYKPVVNQDGDVVRWVATATDIDERKHAEERTRNENLALREQIDRDSMFEDIVGSSEALRKVLRQVAKVAPCDSTVLILGETGTGKELVARAVHKRSGRSERAFIGVNCAAIPPSLFASELFGHEKGAFTGATQRRVGRFESANGGTIFLDEVGDLPQEIQIALLRVLQEHEIERVGSNKAIAVDVRVLAATHRDLDTLVAQGKFREDLLYRLNVVPIQMPALRERADDIPVLVHYFIGRIGKKAGKKFRTIDKKTTELFKAYPWPGNVRELQNVIERAVILSEEDAFCVDETWLKGQPSRSAATTVALTDVLQQKEKEMIEAALTESGGRVSGPGGAAARLGIPRPTLDAKIKRLGINKYHFRGPSA